MKSSIPSNCNHSISTLTYGLHYKIGDEQKEFISDLYTEFKIRIKFKIQLLTSLVMSIAWHGPEVRDSYICKTIRKINKVTQKKKKQNKAKT